MNIKINRAGLVLMVFLIGLPASAGELVPFRAVLDTEPVPVGSCGPGCIELDITGVGQATHMGRTEIQGPSEVDVILGEQTGTSTLTAANGDTLVIEFAGTVVFEGPDPTDPVSFEGTWKVVDGTGRFADVTGSGTYSGTAAGPVGSLLLVGRVSPPRKG